MAKRRRRRNRQEQADIVRRFRESGLTQQAFADKLDLNPTVLGRWVRLAREGKLPDPTPLVLPVRVRRSRPRETAPLELVLRSGHVIRVPAGFDEATLGRLIEALERC